MSSSTATRHPGHQVTLSHRFADELPELALPWQAEPAPAPRLLTLDDDVAADVGLDPAWLRTDDGLRFLTGEAPPAGAHPVAQVYAGHQFGSYSPRLGDGRALLLGELTSPAGAPHDLHLKGSGRTPFARAGDGLAAVGPMLREHVVSAAMHALGVPTTRALAVVATGRSVRRERALPGAVLARTASSHLRVGTFQYARSLQGSGHDSSRGDLLRRLADHAVARHHPHAADAGPSGSPARYRALLDAVVVAQAHLVAQWMLLGFVHGVMNTDNMTISGQTIDYGPCAFLDVHDPEASFSSIDTGGRYAYGQQPAVAEWDLARLAEAMLPLLVDGDIDGTDSTDGTDADSAADALVQQAVEVAQASLAGFRPAFGAAWSGGMRRKVGLPDDGLDDAVAGPLVDDLLALMRTGRVDHTSFFRDLAGAARGDAGAARAQVLDPAVGDAVDAWLQRWRALAPDAALMDRTNPLYVPRNHLVEEALDAATAGDLAPLERLVAVLRRPFTEQPGAERHAEPAPEAFGPYTTFCGT